ncbi:MAG: eL32 family ribosomal protein [Candidatus Pacearchaeota archaeon]
MEKKKKPKFLRTGYFQYSKLGLRRKKKQKYRKAKGGNNKIRLKMKGHLTNVSIGYRSNKRTRNLIKGFLPKIINSIDDLKNLKKDEIAILAKLGKKKKIMIAEYSLKNNIKILNLNPKKFLEKIEEEKKKKKEQREAKKTEKDKKVKEKEKKKEEQNIKQDEKEKSIEEVVKKVENNVKTEVEEKK